MKKIKEEKKAEHGRSTSLLAFLDEVVLKHLHAARLEVMAAVEVATEERAEDGDEVTVVVLEALRQSAPLGVERLELVEERILLALKPSVEHDAEHVVVHHELQPPPDHDALGGGARVLPHVLHHEAGLLLPPDAVLRHHLVGEEGHRHDPPHLPPVVAVHGEHHVLAFPREDVEDDVAGAGAELHALRVEHLLGELRGGDHHQVADAHPEEEDVAEPLGEGHQVAVVEVVADLQPVAHHGGARGARGQAVALAG